MVERTPLRLLIAGIKWPPETFLKRLILGLADRAVDVTVGSSKRPDPELSLNWLPMPNWDGHYGPRMARLVGMAVRAWARSPRDIVRFAGEVRSGGGTLGERLRRWNRLLPFVGGRWDVIYFPWNSGAVDRLPVLNGNWPIVISCRGSLINVTPHTPGREEFGAALRVTFERSAKVHCVSTTMAREAEHLGLDRRKASIIRPAVDPEAYRPSDRDRSNSGILHLMMVGTLNWKKGLEYALQAVGLLKEREVRVRLDIIGDGIARQRVVYAIHDLGLSDVVRLRGRKSPHEVARQLASADVFLLSSLCEGISNAALEAMASGVPVVTTDCGGMREAITDGVEGFVVPLRDPQAMADAIQKLFVAPDLRARMGHAGRERVLREVSLQNQITQWVDLLKSVAENGRREPFS